jgi:hypothetical protein
MPHNADRFYADTPHSGGLLWKGAAEWVPLGAAAPVLTRASAGLYSWNRTAAGAETIQFVSSLDSLRRPIAASTSLPQLQSQFGGTVGPMPAPGRPPFTGTTHLVPPTGGIPKDIIIDDVVFVYNNTVVGITSITPKISIVTYADNVANPTVVDQPLAVTPVLPLAARANDYLVKVPFTTPAQATVDNTEINIEVQFVLANTGVLKFRGVGFHYRFNFN